MKIAINCSHVQPKGGGAKEATVNLISNLAQIDRNNEYIIYVLSDMVDYAKKVFPGSFRIKTIPFHSGLTGTIKRSLFSQSFWYKEEETEKFDLFHSPFFYAPKFRNARIVMTVHDVRLYRYPQTYKFIRYLYLRHSVKESVQRVDKILASSEFTKKELIELCRALPQKIKVVLLAINKGDYTIRDSEKLNIDSQYNYLRYNDFILAVGHIEPRKNYERLLKSFELLKNDARNRNLKLIIVGQPSVDAKQIIEKINKIDGVIYLNFVSHDMLLWLYNNAKLFVFPSIYEGFGLTPLEAACFGNICAVSNASSIPEVCGDGAAYFNPYDIEDMKNVISECLYNNDLRNQLQEKMQKQINKFSWKKHAVETLNVYKELNKK